MFEGAFEDQTVLVTGLAGAKGTWIGWYLLQAGATRIVGIDSADQLDGTCFAESGLPRDSRVELIPADVRDTERLSQIIADTNPSAALHLAGMAIVGDCRQHPFRAYSVNTLGTAAFLECMRTTDLSRGVVVTTDKVYRDTRGRPWQEDDPLFGTGPYSVSKASADIITRDYYDQYLQSAGKTVTVARAGNVLVPGDAHQGRIYVDVAHALARRQQPVILNPVYTRPYTFVGDIAAGYLTLLAKCDRPDVAGEAFNFGPDHPQGVPNGELATKMCELWDAGITWKQGTERPEPFEHQSLDSTKAADLLGWRTVYSLDQALAALVKWYKAQAEGTDRAALGSLTRDIIAEHVSTAAEQGLAWAAG